MPSIVTPSIEERLQCADEEVTEIIAYFGPLLKGPAVLSDLMRRLAESSMHYERIRVANKTLLEQHAVTDADQALERSALEAFESVHREFAAAHAESEH